MAENGDRRGPEQSASNTRESTPSSVPELSSSINIASERSEAHTPTDSQHLPLYFPRIATNSGHSSRSATPLSQASDNDENGENDNGSGNGDEDMRDDVTVAGSLASSEGHAWPFGASREPTPATNGNAGEDNTSEIGSDRNGSRFERSQAPTPSSHMPTPRERTPTAERRSRSLNTVEEDAEEGASRDQEQLVDQDGDMEVLDSIETEEGDGDGDDNATE